MASIEGNLLRDKVAIVTGSAQGIGLVLAEQLGLAGAAVVLADRNADAATAAASKLGESGIRASPVGVDVADEDSVAAMVDSVITEFGRIDVLVNNAAIFSTIEMKPFDQITLAEWRSVIDVNLTGVFLCCRAVAPIMRARGSGRIINMSSSTVLFGRPNYLHYVASKSAVVGLTRAVARELGGDGITVNSIMPGSVETEVRRDSVSPEQAAQIVAGQSIPRRLQPNDIAGAVLFLASDSAALMTGQTVVVDGGSNFV